MPSTAPAAQGEASIYHGGAIHSALFRAALQGWKRGRRNKDPEAKEIADAILMEPWAEKLVAAKPPASSHGMREAVDVNEAIEAFQGAAVAWGRARYTGDKDAAAARLASAKLRLKAALSRSQEAPAKEGGDRG